MRIISTRGKPCAFRNQFCKNFFGGRRPAVEQASSFTLKFRATDLELKLILILPSKKAVVISWFEVSYAFWWPYRQYLVKELSQISRLITRPMFDKVIPCALLSLDVVSP